MVQVSQAPHWPTEQSTGQANPLQGRSRAAGHASPPCAASASTTTSERCVPPSPQLLVHVVHGWKVCWQCSGQWCVLQDSLSDATPHALPPWAAADLTDLDRLRTPPTIPSPHGSEHAFQPPQVSMAQSTGHGWPLQGSASYRCSHALPPWLAATKTARERRLVPPPHVLVQPTQALQPDTTQSTGHETS